MPGFLPDPPPPGHHGNAASASEGSDVTLGSLLDLPTSSSSSPELKEDEDEDGSWSQDGVLRSRGRLERRWVLWHEFMKEHAHLDAWLRLAERAVRSPDPAHVTFASASEELKRLERLRREAGAQLVHLDVLTRRNRTLTQLFQGAMRARLLAAARECGRRWDDVNGKLESATRQLKLFVSEWEEFEAEREELAVWLADLDVRLAEVDQLTGNTCEKLRRLQSFQQCVCTNSSRVNALLRRGETLIQRSTPADGQRVESRLLELLRHCSLVYGDIARTHTRLLSMRLVFEDDGILAPATDSGCPSESLLEEEGALDKLHLDVPAESSTPTSSPPHLPPPPPSPSVPTHEHQGLEWDPSVDIGRSVSHDDADSSYFSIGTGRCHRDGLKRRSYLSSSSEISNEFQEADGSLEEWLDHAYPRPLPPVPPQVSTDSAPDRKSPVETNGGFDGGRVRAWLGVQSPAPSETRTSCSRAVQTESFWEKSFMGINHVKRDEALQLTPDSAPSLSHDLKASADWTKPRQRWGLPQAEEDEAGCEDEERLVGRRRATSSSSLRPALLFLLLAAALTVLVGLLWLSLEPACRRGGGFGLHRGFHLTLRYVNGPPPT
ncbi:uncharacterized protein V6R79_010218 [Siganus canaliculatus]